MVCFRKIKIVTKYQLKRHFNTMHPNFYVSKSESQSREKLASELKEAFLVNDAKEILEYIESHSDQFKVQRDEIQMEYGSINNGALKASYSASLIIAQSLKPFSDRPLFKKVCKEMLLCYGEDGKKMSESIESVPLSRNTVTRRVEDLIIDLDSGLKNKFKMCSNFSLALDESCDISDTSQLVLAIRMVDSTFDVSEEIFGLIPLLKHTRGVDIFNAVMGRLNLTDEAGRLSAVCTDGAPAMVGKKDGFVGQLIKNNIHIPTFHCIIHQESLCAKWTNSIDTMNMVIKVVNKIRGGHNALTHRKLKAFLNDCGSQYGDL